MPSPRWNAWRCCRKKTSCGEPEREKDRRLRKAEKEREWKERRALAELRLSGARQNAGVTSPAVKPQDLPRNDEERAALLEDVINRRLSDLLSCRPKTFCG